jgi:hypothetical protein
MGVFWWKFSCGAFAGWAFFIRYGALPPGAKRAGFVMVK